MIQLIQRYFYFFGLRSQNISIPQKKNHEIFKIYTTKDFLEKNSAVSLRGQSLFFKPPASAITQYEIHAQNTRLWSDR